MSRGAQAMNTGKTLFAQLMDYLPWSTFTRIVVRYDGDHRVRTLSCAEQYRVMAFAQLTYRESLRDIEVCLSAQTAKLYHAGFREPVRRATLADANEARDWRIYAEFAHRLIAQARRLYAGDSLGLELANAVYALDSTTIDLCLSVFPWAHFRSTKAAVKMHTLLDLRGNIPSFIHVSDGKLHDVHALDMLLPEPGAIYVMDRGYVDFSRLHVLHQAGAFFVTRAKSNLDAHRVYSASTNRSGGVIADQTIALDGHYTSQDYPAHLRRIRFKDPETGKTLVFLTNHVTLPALTICALYKSRWQVELFFDDFPYCTPSYAIEKTESVDWDYTIAEFLGEETLSETWQRQPSEAPKEHSNRLELPADALAGSYATPLNL